MHWLSIVIPVDELCMLGDTRAQLDNNCLRCTQKPDVVNVLHRDLRFEAFELRAAREVGPPSQRQFIWEYVSGARSITIFGDVHQQFEEEEDNAD